MLEIAWRSALSFFILLFLTRLLGKKQISQLTFFNYITGITIGSLTAIISLDKTVPFINGVTSLAVWGGLTIIAGYITLKSPRTRILIDGEPTIVIKNGKIDEKALASLRLNMDDLMMLIRKKNIFSIKEVDYAILEPNGSLSVLKKPEKQSTVKEDLMTAKPMIPSHLYLPAELIVDGNIVKRNLKKLNLDEAWLVKQLQEAQTTIKDVFYAEIQSDGSLHIDKKELIH